MFDRNGEYLVQSRECYDLMVIYREMDREGFDTTLFCQVTGLSREGLVRELANARVRPRAPRMVMNYMSKEDKLRFDECNFAGFYTVYRTARQYPRKVGGNLLGYVGEVNSEMFRRYPSYQAGEYVGISGVESAYEPELRGKRGEDLRGGYARSDQGSYMDGRFDSLPVPGKSIVCTIDARLQLFAEELMAGKVGAAVAIEPSTGEILMMVSSPTYDPDELVGRQRGNHYMELLYNKRQPLFNRAVSGRLSARFDLQTGSGPDRDAGGCADSFHALSLSRGLSGRTAQDEVSRPYVACGPAFCRSDFVQRLFLYVFRDILENPEVRKREGGVRRMEGVCREFRLRPQAGFGFSGRGQRLCSRPGLLRPRYRGSWNSLTVLSLSIGQGALDCTPLQMANLAAIVANRGYYYIPHIVPKIEGRDFAGPPVLRNNYTKVDPKYFEPIVEGMWRGVHVGRNLADGASRRVGCLRQDGYGAESSRPRPLDLPVVRPEGQPEIAISVYVENGGFGASAALPIASLLEEYYLTDTVRRPAGGACQEHEHLLPRL